MDIKKLVIRTISGLIYAGIIIACILCGTNTVFLLAGILATLATIELAKIQSDSRPRRLPTLMLDIAGNLALCCAIYVFPLFIWIAIMLIRIVEELYIKSDSPIKALSHSLFSQIYIGIPLGCMAAISAMFFKPTLLLAVFLFIWINDTGAFLVGSAIGRHRLFERISPKKSWEGFIGGLFFNIVAASVFCVYCPHFFGLPASMSLWIGLAVTVTIFGTWGDLVESMIKRSLHIKDSGAMIPGHGGILDRIDSLLLAAPAVLLYMLIVIYWHTAVILF